MIFRQVIEAVPPVSVNAASKTIRSELFDTEYADFAVLLLTWSKIGSPSGSNTMVITPVFVDDAGNQYTDSNTTYGTITVKGTDTNTAWSVQIPYLVRKIGLVIAGDATLSSSTGFIVSARLVLVGNTDVPVIECS